MVSSAPAGLARRYKCETGYNAKQHTPFPSRSAIPTLRRYGAPIGSASKDICAGEYVHIQNLDSDYLPSYTLEPIEQQD